MLIPIAILAAACGDRMPRGSSPILARQPALDWVSAPSPTPTASPSPKPRPQKPPERPVAASAGTCTATWFSGSRGAYGRLEGFFAAHRTYPARTRLRVSHGGRSVIVTVLDYGPAAWTGHCIDLAPAAFRELASLGAGVIRVDVKRVS